MMAGRIYKIRRVIIPVVLIMGLVSCSESPQQDKTSPEATVEVIHERLLTLDSHVDIADDYTYLPEYDPGAMTQMKVDLPKMAAGGLDGAFFIVYAGQTRRTAENYAAAKALAIRKFDAIHRMTDEMYGDRIGLAYSPDDVRRIYKEGRKVAIIGIENGYVIGKDIKLVEDYYNRGARYMTLAHNGHNDICDSAQPKAEFGDSDSEHDGVSDFGAQVIREMNRLGMMVDISHVSMNCMIQATKMSKAPVIASHSSVRALMDHPRNLNDDQMQLLASRGGVMQLVAYTGFIKSDPLRSAAFMALTNSIMAKYDLGPADYEALQKTAEWTAGRAELDRRYPIATVREFVDHIDYAVKLIGIDHVGISSDFDGGGGLADWQDASETLNVTRELVRRGYSETDIAKIWGGNLLRVWAVVGKAAKSLKFK